MIDKLAIYKAFTTCKDMSYSSCICIQCPCNQKTDIGLNRTICEELCDTLYKKCAEISAISNATQEGYNE